MSVSTGDADEVSEGEVNPDGEEASPEEVEFLVAGEGELGLWGNHDVGSLEDGQEVDDAPDGLEGVRHDGQDASSSELSSGGVRVVADPVKEEDGSDDEWDLEQDAHEHVPPSNILTDEMGESLGEDEEGKEESQQGNAVDSTLNWDASETAEVFSLLLGASTEAAAASAVFVFLNFVEVGRCLGLVVVQK